MFSKSTWLHLRIPFSIFLLPVFLFAYSQVNNISLDSFVLILVILHLFIYPASNGYNSYFDKDEGPIGGLANPPAVDKSLFYVSLLFDLIGIILSLLISVEFALSVLIYGLISKAYSHPSIRLKKYPIMGLLSVGIFQGFFIYLAVTMAFLELKPMELIEWEYLFPAMISSVLLIGSYPMTQIYQHDEDSKRGDKTLSLMLGIQGTFIFTAIVFLGADILFGIYFYEIDKIEYFYYFQIFLIPVLSYFQVWMFKAWNDKSKVDHRRTMRLNKISSLAMIAFFILIKFI